MPRKHQPVEHSRYKAASSCERKRQFASENAALEAVEQAMLRDMSLELATYRCPYCAKWHLTSVKDSAKR